MVKNGILITCDRCGKTMFQECRLDGEFDYGGIPETAGWKGVKEIGDLCPDCAVQYQETIEDFLERGRREI